MSAQPVSTTSTRNLQEAESYCDRWLKFINSSTLSEADARFVASESVRNFSEHFNQGWLEYRKSVTEGGDAACTEWKGEGSTFEDVLGRKFIDCLGGYGLLNLGWNHSDVVAAVKSQLTYHTAQPSQELLDPLRGVLAKLLSQLLPGDIQYCFFCNSGTEAVEGALKLAKLYTGKNGFITSVKGFHGKSMGSLSVSGKSVFREPCGTLYGGPVYHLPYGDASAVEQTLKCCEAVGVGIAAVIMEPIQGEAGAICPPDDFWPRLREITRKYGVLLIADEVQTGLGRTGKLFGVDHWNVQPDIMTLGKALGGGVMPCAAFCSTKQIWEKMMNPNPFIHTTTTGGNPLACAAAIAALKVTLRDKLWEQAAEKGKFLMDKLKLLQLRFPNVLQNVTGKGLLLAMHFHDSAMGYKVAANLFKQRVLVAGTLNSAQSIRLEPPLIITYDQLNQVVSCLEKALVEVSKQVEQQKKVVATAGTVGLPATAGAAPSTVSTASSSTASSSVAQGTSLMAGPAAGGDPAAQGTTTIDTLSSSGAAADSQAGHRKRVHHAHHKQVVSDEEDDTEGAGPQKDDESSSSSSSSEDEEDKSDGDIKKPARVHVRKCRKLNDGHRLRASSVAVDEDGNSLDAEGRTVEESLSPSTFFARPTEQLTVSPTPIFSSAKASSSDTAEVVPPLHL